MALGRSGLIRRRTTWLFIIFALFYGLLAARLYVIQCRNNDQYREWAQLIRCRKLVLQASRGRILDRTGKSLAVSIQTASVYANRKEAGKRLSSVAATVADLVGRDKQSMAGALDGSASIVWLCRQIDPRLCERVSKRTDLQGVGVSKDTKRVYPSGSMAAQVLGFTNIDGLGVEGLEHTLNRFLAGRDGICKGELDAQRRVIPETRYVVREPENGKDVYLTIDMTIQHVAEVALARMAGTFKPSSACAVVMDSRTGEILALANYPACVPKASKSARGASGNSLWRNRAVADLYEPGSTLKVVTVAAAINEGVSPSQVVAHCAGSEQIPGGRIRCSLHKPYLAGHGVVDMTRLIEQSCNIGAAHLAERMGSKKLYGYEKTFGLLTRPRAGFGCEAAYEGMPMPEDWRPMKLANVGFGQGIAVSALQMSGVYQTIANDGVRVQPHIVREVRNSDGSVYKPFKVGDRHRVVSTKAARETTELLMKCVLNGTGKNAKIEGRSVAGKTGSAQIALPKGGYESGAFVASFMGFAPARHPRLVIAVVVHRPQGSNWGATVAAPVFQEIGEKALWHLRVPADEPVAPPKEQGDRKSLV